MIVADANLVTYFLLSGDLTAAAENVRKSDNKWIAPAIIRLELLQILNKYIRANLMTRDVALRKYHQGLSLLTQHDFEAPALSVLQLGEVHKISAYDAQYVLLAEKSRIQLITADKQLVDTFPEYVRSISSFA